MWQLMIKVYVWVDKNIYNQFQKLKDNLLKEIKTQEQGQFEYKRLVCIFSATR